MESKCIELFQLYTIHLSLCKLTPKVITSYNIFHRISYKSCFPLKNQFFSVLTSFTEYYGWVSSVD